MNHDPTAYAWFVVLAYAVAACASGVAASRAEPGRTRLFWAGTTALLILLGLNKQLDLQEALTDVARGSAHAHGWFEYRRTVQGVFLLLLGCVAVVAGVFLAMFLRGGERSARWAAGGILLLATFVFIRAAAFHHIDHWTTITVAGLRSGWWLELAGTGVIGVAAAVFVRGKRTSPRPD